MKKNLDSYFIFTSTKNLLLKVSLPFVLLFYSMK